MTIRVFRAKTLQKLALLLLCTATAALLLYFPQATATGVKRGLAVCAQLLIPSLFPFLVLTGFMIRAGLVHGIGRRLDPVTRRLFGLSGAAQTAMLLSFLGGYPTGAAAVKALCDQETLDSDEAARLMCVCVNAGPAFVIGGVGVGMLGSVKAGILLLIAHWCASLLTAVLFRGKAAAHTPTRSRDEAVFSAVAASVHAATTALIAMCGFVLLASAMLSLTDALGGASAPHAVWRRLLACITEVTSGCVESAYAGSAMPFWIGATLGFGGLSVHGQIAVTVSPHRVIGKRFYAARLLHALLGGVLSAALFWWFPPPVNAVSAAARLSAFSEASTLAVPATALVALMLFCMLFLYTLPQRDRA